MSPRFMIGMGIEQSLERERPYGPSSAHARRGLFQNLDKASLVTCLQQLLISVSFDLCLEKVSFIAGLLQLLIGVGVIAASTRVWRTWASPRALSSSGLAWALARIWRK